MLAALAESLADLVLPRCCVGCGRAGVPLCPMCVALDVHDVCLADLPVVAATRYEGAVRTALVAYKERGRRDLGRWLGAALSHAVEVIAPPGTVLVPVPSSASARRDRGGDHVGRLARVAARAASPAGRLHTSSPLRLGRVVQDSAGLDIAARAANLHAAMLAAAPGSGHRRAVIVDDIVTTGATLREAARALRAAGWVVDGAAVVAATARRHPPRNPDQLGTNPVTHTPGRSLPSGLT